MKGEYLSIETIKKLRTLEMIEEELLNFKNDLRLYEIKAKEQKKSNDISIQLVGIRINKMLNIIEETK